jgi:LemA protein
LACFVIAIVGIAIVVALFVWMTYNRLITLRNRVDNAWAQIDVQLKRRYDLIPNLVETVKGYMTHERETLEDVTRYRAAIMTGGVAERAEANNMLSQTLKSLFAVAENYPNLKANENFKMLQEELAGTENKISYIRTAYNDSVLEYKTAKETFPTNLVAGMFASTFPAKPFFETAGVEREAVKVSFAKPAQPPPADPAPKAAMQSEELHEAMEETAPAAAAKPEPKAKKAGKKKPAA